MFEHCFDMTNNTWSQQFKIFKMSLRDLAKMDNVGLRHNKGVLSH